MKRFTYFLFNIGIFLGLSLIASAQAPVANFSATPLSGCSPIVTQFTDLSTNNPTSWLWDLGNGTQSTLQNPSTVYINPGTYTVTLIATNASGSNTKVRTSYVTVIPSPTVSFAAVDSSAGCNGKTVQFTNSSAGNSAGATSYFWDFGDGNTSTATAPVHTYTSNGNYSVTLVVTNSAGCTKSLTKTNYIQVFPRPTAGFSMSNNNGCTLPVTVSFSNTSSGGSTYAWSFGDGNNSNAVSPTHTYTAAGSYNVRLIVTSANGCKDTFTASSAVNIGTLTAGFSQSASNTCTGYSVSFTNTTTPGAANSSWYFGDGGTAGTTNASHTYAAAGLYTVKLIVQNGSCVDSVTHQVNIAQGPHAAFSATPTSHCAVPFTTQFSNSSTGGGSYLWDFGDGNTSTATAPSHTYTAFGNYTVRLVATSSNGCRDTLTMPAFIQLQQNPCQITSSANYYCAPVGTSLDVTCPAGVSIASYNWSFGDGSPASSAAGPIIHIYTNVGTYYPSLTYTTTTGCTNTITYTPGITAVTRPVASFDTTHRITCPEQAISFTNSSTGGFNYTWIFGDGGTSSAANPVHYYGGPGTYTVKLVVSNGVCSDTMTAVNMITVYPPQALFTATYPCNNRRQWTFTNGSIGATSYTWNFGDGSPTTNATNTSHTYAANGDYVVSLTAHNSTYGCTSTYNMDVHVYDLVASVSASDTTICKGETALFTAAYNPNYASVIFRFGDGSQQSGGTAGSPPTTISAGHVYSAAGIYTVKVVVADAAGCKDSMTRASYMRVGGPSVDFSATPLGGCPAVNVDFTDQSVPGGGFALTSRTWTFGDGGSLTSGGTTASHLYLAGSYSVKLVVTDANGCKDSTIKPSYINVLKPTAAFTASNTIVCKGTSVQFNNTSNLNYPPGTYLWDFGDNTTSTSVNPSHIYTTAGNYTVRLIVTDGNGCKDTLIRGGYITVPQIQASFTMSDSVANCPPMTLTVNSTSTGAVSQLWNFGNSNTSTQVSASTAYTTPGIYTVKLRVTSVGGCIDTASKTVTVNGPIGTFTYTPSSGCSPITINFTATATNVATYTWDFNNGVTQTTSTPSFTYVYTQDGYFLPKLILSNGLGCNIPLFGGDTIKVNKADAGFIAAPSPVCVGVAVQFTDTSSAVTSPITTREWSFGDNTSSTAANPSHTYTTAGTYNVRLIAGTPGGCRDTAFKTIIVNPLPVVSAASQAICPTDSAQMQATGAATYNWTPATGLSCTTCANPKARPLATTTYTITGTTAAGCQASAQTTVTVNPAPTVTASAAPATICAGSTTTLNAGGSGATTFAWTPAAAVSSPNSANTSAAPTATTTYKVVGTSNAGCKDSTTVAVMVNPMPVLTLSPNTSICPGGNAPLTASGAATYSWSPSGSLSCNSCNNPVATPLTSTTYTVTGTTNGCSSSGQVSVAVNTVPVIAVTGNNTICSGSGTQLQATGANSYSWSPATGLSNPNISNPVASPTATTVYTVTGSSGAGCSGVTTFTVTVNPLPVITAGPAVAICSGASTTLSSAGGLSYTWSPATGLSNANTANPVASPTATTTYTVTGTSAAGCIRTAQTTVTVNPLPVVAATATPASICPNGSSNLLATGASTYSWSPSGSLSSATSASPTATPTATTTYTVTGTTAAGCSANSQVTVAVNSQPFIAISGTNAVCAGGSTTLTASGATSYSWSPAAGVASPTSASTSITPTATTVYTVTGTNSAGCTGTATVTVTVNPLPVVAATATPATICLNGSSSLQASGAATYSWSPAGSLSSATSASPTATPTATTTYTVTGTTAAGCSSTGTVTVNVAPNPVMTVSPNQTICTNGSTTLTAGGASTYNWSPAGSLGSPTSASTTASPTATTTYTVTGTSAAGCTGTANVTVTVVSQPTIAVSGNNAVCAGGNTTLTASGANSYSWSPAAGVANPTSASTSITPTGTTTYTVTGTSGAGCVGSTTVTVTVNPLPTVAASAAPTGICPGGSSNLQASGAATYSWSPAGSLSSATSASPTATPTATTTYTVTGTTAAGCSSTGTVTVNVAPNPVMTVSPNQTICTNGSTTLTAGGASTYSWSPAGSLGSPTSASTTASPTATTTYTVTGTSAAGCTGTANVTVTVVSQPTIAVSGNNAVCAGGNTTLTASGANSYSWSPAAGVASPTSASTSITPTGTTTYTVTGTSGAGCVGSTTVTVTVNPLPTVAASAAPTGICPGGSSNLQASGAATYSWSPAGSLSNAAIANPVATPTASTTYTVTGTTAAGCSNTASIAVNVLTPPTITAASNLPAVCVGASAQLSAGGGVSYAWSPATGLNNASIANPVATPTATTTYTVTGTGANGCTSTASVTIVVNPLPVVNAGQPATICAGSSTTLQATGASTYSWSPAAGLSNPNIANPVASPTATTSYTVTGTSAAGCVSTAQVLVTVTPLPVVSAGNAQAACQGVAVQLQATGANTYSWSPATGLSNPGIANPTATPAGTTTYTLTGTANGCAATAQVTVTVKPLPPVNAGPDVSVCNGNGISLNATGADSYVWTPATGLSCTTCANPVATPATPTAYTVTGTGTNGCTASDAVNVSFFPAANISAGADVSLCRGQSAQLQASGGISYVWSPGASLNCTACPNPSASPVDNITYQVIGTDANGCKDSDEVAVTVIQPQPVAVGPGGDICEGEYFQLSASGGSSYKWTPAGTLSSSSSATPVATPTATTTYTVNISQSGCFDYTKQVTVTVHPKPVVDAGADQHVIAGSQTRILTTSTNASTYAWTPPAELSCADCASPVAAPIQTTTYTVVATSSFGCRDTDQVTIYVDCDNNQIWVPNTFTPNGDGENDWFYPHAKGVSTVKRFRIYNRWGEIIFDRSDMPVNDRYLGWDGTSKNLQLKPDVYVYVIDATCSTGQPLQIRGDISLIR